MPHCNCHQKKKRKKKPTVKQTEYRNFFKKHRKAGKTAKEIGIAWKAIQK